MTSRPEGGDQASPASRLAASSRAHPAPGKLQASAAELGQSHPIGPGRWPARSPPGPSPAMADWGECGEKGWCVTAAADQSPFTLATSSALLIPSLCLGLPGGGHLLLLGPFCPGSSKRKPQAPFPVSGPTPLRFPLTFPLIVILAFKLFFLKKA